MIPTGVLDFPRGTLRDWAPHCHTANVGPRVLGRSPLHRLRRQPTVERWLERPLPHHVEWELLDYSPFNP